MVRFLVFVGRWLRFDRCPVLYGVCCLLLAVWCLLFAAVCIGSCALSAFLLFVDLVYVVRCLSCAGLVVCC